MKAPVGAPVPVAGPGEGCGAAGGGSNGAPPEAAPALKPRVKSDAPAGAPPPPAEGVPSPPGDDTPDAGVPPPSPDAGVPPPRPDAGDTLPKPEPVEPIWPKPEVDGGLNPAVGLLFPEGVDGLVPEPTTAPGGMMPGMFGSPWLCPVSVVGALGAVLFPAPKSSAAGSPAGSLLPGVGFSGFGD